MDGLNPKKSLGQHWLDDPASLQAMLGAAQVGPKDTILEIGPGPGSLTGLLVKRAKRVIAVELDAKLANGLNSRLAADNLVIINQDILNFDYGELPADYKIVANIPYYLTSHLIQLISEATHPPQTAALLVQQQVAERAAAKPGAMSLLSVTAQFYWRVSIGQRVPARLFTPPPKVDSQILILNKREEPLFSDVNLKDFFRLVKAGFAQRRKTLLNSLSAGLQLSREQAKAILKMANIDPGRRAQTLSLDEWYSLYKAKS